MLEDRRAKERQLEDLLETLLEFSKVYAVFGKGVSFGETGGRVVDIITREWFQSLLDVESMLYNRPKIRVVRTPFNVNYVMFERRVMETLLYSKLFIEKGLIVITELRKELKTLGDLE